MIASARRWFALIVKELIQMRRDRMTFSMMLSVPLMQLALFGYAVNSDPKHLPAVVIDADQGPFGRAFISALEVSDYFDIVKRDANETEAERMIASGEAQFVVTIPEGFSRDVMRGDRPELLVEADATDPAATSNALGNLGLLAATALDRDLSGPLSTLRQGSAPYQLVVHKRYNEEGNTQFNVVPGLIGVVLSSTMVIMTAMAMTRERERGTLENILVTPITPFEMMMGKIAPYILIGLVQTAIILLASAFMFDVPFEGSLFLLFACCMLFICANLAIGFIFSTIARTQLQAMQMASTFLLPSILLSGFMFPFRGMPGWAQGVGEALPLTHFLRIVRGIVLKGSTFSDIAFDFWMLAVILVVICAMSLRLYRRTLD